MNAALVCVDCSPLLVRSAGVKTYLFHWLAALQSLDPGSVRTFLAPSTLSDLRHTGGLWRHPVRLALLQALNRFPPSLCDAVVPACDLFHASNLLRKLPRRPLSTTVHDLTTWIMPEFHQDAVVAAENRMAAAVLKQAAGIIAVSESTKRDAIRILALDPEKIRVIYPGISQEYFSVTPTAAAHARKRYRLDLPFFLFVGTIEPRKNLDRLLTAWEALPLAFQTDHQLVIAGMPGWRSSATLQRLLRICGENRGVRFLRYVPESDMPGLTAAAHALVYPSLYEGFGFPVAQAMAAGCPVITSNVSSLPEITAGAALLVEPLDVTQLIAAIRRMAESPALCESLRAEGLRNAARFTWQTAAIESRRFFMEIAGR